ncbi:hypothetical protein [Bradyrhizobium sp. ORS 86]|uniref:hypothetical protein n=1 Tax=Bradyrhizobium sp. ORS 86 TaxID=1685970 RepID=UPI003890418F
MLHLLPIDSIASWLKRWPGIKIVARDPAALYRDGTRYGAHDAVQVADRWRLLNSSGEALRHAVGRHRHNVAAAVQIMASAQRAKTGSSTPPPALLGCPADRKAATRTLGFNLSPTRAGLPDSRVRTQLIQWAMLAARWTAAKKFLASLS